MKRTTIIVIVFIMILFSACTVSPKENEHSGEISVSQDGENTSVGSRDVSESNIDIMLNYTRVSLPYLIIDGDIYADLSAVCKLLNINYQDQVEYDNTIHIITDETMLNFEFEIDERTAVDITDAVCVQLFGEGYAEGRETQVIDRVELKQFEVARYVEGANGGTITVIVNKADGRIVSVTITE